MEGTLQLVAGPTDEPVSLDMMKRHLRIELDQDAEDTLLAQLIGEARAWCETYTSRAFLPQTWRLSLHRFDGATRLIELPRPPLLSVVAFEYLADLSAPSAWTPVPASGWAADTGAEPGCVRLAYGGSWPVQGYGGTNAVRVTFQAGWADIDSVPKEIVAAIRQVAANMFRFPHAEDGMPGRDLAVCRLLASWRMGSMIEPSREPAGGALYGGFLDG